MGVAAVIATVSIHDLVHMAITQFPSSDLGYTPTQQHTAFPLMNCTVQLQDIYHLFYDAK